MYLSEKMEDDFDDVIINSDSEDIDWESIEIVQQNAFSNHDKYDEVIVVESVVTLEANPEDSQKETHSLLPRLIPSLVLFTAVC